MNDHDILSSKERCKIFRNKILDISQTVDDLHDNSRDLCFL
jgi:hypothetical protein